MVEVERAVFLKVLEGLDGVRTASSMDQSDCFLFSGGRVYCLGEDAVMGAHFNLDGFEGAVPSGLLLSLLRKWPEEKVRVNFEGGKMMLTGEKAEAELGWEEIRASLDGFRFAEEDKNLVCSLDDKGREVLRKVTECVRKDLSLPLSGYVHLTPSCVEVCNNFQALRYSINLGLNVECLVSGKSLGKLVQSNVEGIFDKGDQLGLVLEGGFWAYLIKYRERYPSLDNLFVFDPLIKVKVSAEEVERALQLVGGFSEGSRGWVDVELFKDRMVISGRSSLGGCAVVSNVESSGELVFRALLDSLELLAKFGDCWEIGSKKVRVAGDGWVFSIFLSVRK